MSCSSFSSSLYDPGPLHKISSQSVHNFLSNVDKQTNRQTYKRYQKHNLLCKMLSLGGERLPNTNKKKKSFGQLPAPRSGYATTRWCFFAHLLILEYPDHHKNLISSSLYYPGPLHKISSQFVHNFLSNVVHKQTNKQTDKHTNATKNITFFAKC